MLPVSSHRNAQSHVSSYVNTSITSPIHMWYSSHTRKHCDLSLKITHLQHSTCFSRWDLLHQRRLARCCCVMTLHLLVHRTQISVSLKRLRTVWSQIRFKSGALLAVVTAVSVAALCKDFEKEWYVWVYRCPVVIITSSQSVYCCVYWTIQLRCYVKLLTIVSFCIMRFHKDETTIWLKMCLLYRHLVGCTCPQK